MENDESGLFNIEVDSADESTSSTTEKVPRDFQSEESFQAVKREWTAKIENGEIHKTIQLPINARAKPEMQQVLYAIEELYFLGRYEDGKQFAERVLGSKELGDEFRSVVVGYRQRCEKKSKKP